MDKKTRSVTDGSAFTIIIIGLTVVVVGCFLGIRYLFQYGFYRVGDNGQYAKAAAVEIYSREDCDMAEKYFRSVVTADNGNDSADDGIKTEWSEFRNNRNSYYQDHFSPQKTNFIFEFYDEKGNAYPLQTGGYSYEMAAKNTPYKGTHIFYINDGGTMSAITLKFAVLVNKDSPDDRYKSAFSWIDAANSLKYAIFFILFAVLLILIIMLSVATINAGNYDAETGEIIPGFVDKIPLDICTVVVVGFFVVAWTVMGLTTAADVDMVLSNLVTVITFVAFVMLVTSYLMTVSVRVKMGKFYKNTVFYRIYRKFKRKTPRKLRKAFSEMSFYAKIFIGISAYVLVEAAIMIAMAYAGIFNSAATRVFETFLIVWGTTRLILIPIFVLVAVNLNYIKEEGERLAGGILGDDISKKLSIGAFKSHGKNLDQIRQEINKAMEQELKSERLRNELITNVSHDIKTPLTSIKSYVEFLQRDNLSEKERKEYLEIVAKHTDKLALLAKNLIEVSQITSGNIEVKREKVSLNIIIEQTIEEFALKLEKSELMPRVMMPEEEVYIMGDGEWLWRIISNLLNNACKYSASGTDVEISLENNNGKAAIRIANISKSVLNVEGDELLERFVRGDSSRHTEGNGLGLSIAKTLAELQNGTLDISVKGDTFVAVIIFDSIK